MMSLSLFAGTTVLYSKMFHFNSGYNFIDANWDTIEAEFGLIENAYNQKKNQAEQVAKNCMF